MEADLVGSICESSIGRCHQHQANELKIRDQQSASALGLPARIRDEDCDVAMLDTSDIREDDVVDNPGIFGTQNVEDVPYPVEMARLARIRMCRNQQP